MGTVRIKKKLADDEWALVEARDAIKELQSTVMRGNLNIYNLEKDNRRLKALVARMMGSEQ